MLLVFCENKNSYQLLLNTQWVQGMMGSKQSDYNTESIHTHTIPNRQTKKICSCQGGTQYKNKANVTINPSVMISGMKSIYPPRLTKNTTQLIS